MALALAGAPATAFADVDSGQKAYEEGDFRKAYEEWLPLARQGDPAAQRNIGQLYRQGRGVPQSDEVAANWYRLAAQRGHAAAQANLGVMYLQGQGVAKDPAEAARWFEQAAEQGHTIALYNLALMFEQGLGVTASQPRAMGWFQRAAEGGHECAAQRVAQYLADRVAPAAGPAAIATVPAAPAPVAAAASPVVSATRGVETSRSYLYLPREFLQRAPEQASAVARAAPPAAPQAPVDVARLGREQPAQTGDIRLRQPAIAETTPPPATPRAPAMPVPSAAPAPRPPEPPAPPAPVIAATLPEELVAPPRPANDSTPPLAARPPEAEAAPLPHAAELRARHEDEIAAARGRLDATPVPAAAPDFLRREAEDAERDELHVALAAADETTLPVSGALPTFLRPDHVPAARARVPVSDVLRAEAAREMQAAPVTEPPDFLVREAASGNRAVPRAPRVSDALVREARAEREREVAAARHASLADAVAPPAVLMNRAGTPDIPGFNPDAARRAVDVGVVAYLARNYQKAFEFWMLVARTGQPDAQFFIGGLYLDGHGVARDLVEAHAWFTRAAAQGHLRAEESLAMLGKIMTDSQLRQARARIERG